MKKISSWLFVTLMVVIALSACTEAGKPLCPEWAAGILGEYCESASLSITPSDTIGLIRWEIGEIQLNDAYIYNVYGVRFQTLDGQYIDPDDLQDGEFYYFARTEQTGGFRIYPSPNHNPLSPSTHILLARSIK